MKKRSIIFASLSVSTIALYFLVTFTNSEITVVSNPKVEAQNRRVSSPAASTTTIKGPARAVASVNDLSQLRNKEIGTRFEVLLKKHEGLNKYFEHLGYLGNGPDAMISRIWISMGLFLSPDPEEAKLLYMVIDELGQNSDSVMALLEGKQNEIGEDSAFTEQMALPLVYKLNVSAERKASFYGNVINNPMEFSPEGNVTPKTGNITNALIYMKQTNASYSAVEPHLLRAVQASRSDAKSHQELLMRITAYYPMFSER